LLVSKSETRYKMLEFSLIFMDIFLLACDHLIHELNIVSLML